MTLPAASVKKATQTAKGSEYGGPVSARFPEYPFSADH